MNVTPYIPIYGTAMGIKSSYQDDLSFKDQVTLGVQMGAGTFATIVATGGYTRGHITMAQFGVAVATAPVTAIVAVGVGTVLFSDYMSQHDPYKRPQHLTQEYFDMRRKAGY